jgi:hypothetical protein
MLLKHCAKLIVWTAGALNDRPVIQIKLTSYVLHAQMLALVIQCLMNFHIPVYILAVLF